MIENVISQGYVHAVSMCMWHRRFGHANNTVLRKMAQNKAVEDMDNLFQSEVQMYACDVCAKAKQPRHTYHRSQWKAAQSLHIIHSDTMGPMKIAGYLGEKYVVTILDDFLGMEK
jgi:hypothetical protein